MKVRRACLMFLSVCGLSTVSVSPATAQWLDLRVPQRPEVANAEAGQAIYQERCWFCHGDDGDGRGPIAEYLWPRPRDFTFASYKLRTTQSGELPTDEDLFRTITLGMPGTAMPEWESVLSVDARWQVIDYIKTFAADLFEDEAFNPYNAMVEIGSPPSASTASLIESGRGVFDEASCWECHGQSGRGEGERSGEIEDDWGMPILPTDLRAGWKFKGGNSVREIYLRFSSGLDGTPMPSYFETLSEEERWQLAHYVTSLNDGPPFAPSPDVVISARRLEADLPVSADDPAWGSTEETNVPLTGQATYAPRWQVPAVSDVAVRALYNDNEVAVRLTWNDRFADSVTTDFPDALVEGWGAGDTYPRLYPDGERARGSYADEAEIILPLRYGDSPVLPHFIYGSAEQPVDVWRWRADSQVVELRAGGAGRPPEPHPAESQLANGNGVWRDGRWTVVIRRPLGTNDGTGETQLRVGEYIPVAFHVREGSNGETGLRMAISSWYFLHLRQPTPALSYVLVLAAILGTVVLEYVGVGWMKKRANAGELAKYGVAPILAD